MNYSKINYRADIDGLRGLSVSIVLLYHAFPELLPGGFIGVDIFFVISGYLITKIVLNDLENNKFGFYNFYSRRMRRIFPSLITVLFFTLSFGYFYLISEEFQLLGNHTFYGSVFLSNFLLYKESNYFGVLSESKHLLHLWSLGIEEQFYIFFPYTIYILYRLKNIFFGLGLFFLISFILNISLVEKHPQFVFYLPFARVWELLVGSFLVKFESMNSFKENLIIIKNNANNMIKTGISLLLLVICLVNVNKHSNFPGYWAILPTLSASFIILTDIELPFSH